ncbi:MAG: hypothetical protein KJZ87_28500, partial [Thermoguttaceae bacterium]|nr:hypothetical protein [Thermoguttaceae bacterium]
MGDQRGHRPDVADGDFSVAHAGEAADREHVGVRVEVLYFPARHQLKHGPRGGFHAPAGRAENDARTGGGAERLVEVALGHSGQRDAGLADHLGQLAGGEPVVDVLAAAGAHFRPVALELLRRTGHQRHGDDVGRIEAVDLA